MRFALPAAALLALAALSPLQAKESAAGAAETQQALPLATVHKSPYCGCCVKWIALLEEAGFEVREVDTDDLGGIKRELGVPREMASCHTAEIGGYVVEGHVPIQDIERLLREAPDARGIAVPGMPMGSPGMEMPDGRVQPYATLLLHEDGSSEVFARHGEPAQ